MPWELAVALFEFSLLRTLCCLTEPMEHCSCQQSAISHLLVPFSYSSEICLSHAVAVQGGPSSKSLLATSAALQGGELHSAIACCRGNYAPGFSSVYFSIVSPSLVIASFFSCPILERTTLCRELVPNRDDLRPECPDMAPVVQSVQHHSGIRICSN